MSKIAKNPVREIVALHAEIMDAMRVGLDKAIRIGELLTQEQAKLKHGQWLPWAKANLPFTDRTARNYIRVFENRERLKLESVSDLGSAYRLLSAPKVETPEDEEENLFLLKHYWLLCTKKEKAELLVWMAANHK